MRRFPLFLLFAAALAAALPAAALPAAAQTTPRRPPADTVRFGSTRPSAGDSIRMADEEDAASLARRAAADGDEAEKDTVPVKPRSGPYARAAGSGPFSVQASGEAAARPPRGEVVWLDARASRAGADSSRRDTARAGTGQRVASGSTARRDTAAASTNRPARRDTAATTRRDTASTTASRPTRRDTASTTASRPARRDTASTASRPAARDTVRRSGQAATSTTAGRAGSTASTTTTGGRTGSNSGSSRARTHTVAAGETFYGIARRYGVTAAQLRAVNSDVEMDALEIGDVLRLPANARDSRAGPGTGSQRTGAQTPPRTGSAARTHTVAAGETLYGIARRYGVTVDAIRAANDMESDQVRTGQRLVIPPAR